MKNFKYKTIKLWSRGWLGNVKLHQEYLDWLDQEKKLITILIYLEKKKKPHRTNRLLKILIILAIIGWCLFVKIPSV
jgi:hypothetical protein